MGKKILTVFAPVLAIMAFGVMPAMAQAAQKLQIGGGLAVFGSTIQASSSNLKFQSNFINVECSNNDLNIFMQNNLAGTVVGGGFTGPGGAPCGTNNAAVKVDISTNAAAGWAIVFGENDEGALVGPAGIQFTAQLQDNAANDIATCNYIAESVPFSFNQNKDLELTINSEFGLQEGSSEGCSETGTLEGQVVVTSAGGQVVMDN
jgi:hypothetical protein